MLSRGEAAGSGEEPGPELAAQAQELRALWETLQEEAAARHQRLREAEEAQQYYLDADEAEAWVSEQELFMGPEEKPKVRSDSMWCSLFGGLFCTGPCLAGISSVDPGSATLFC